MGADSREFNLEFNITLPHLLDLHPGAKQDAGVFFTGESREDDKMKFKSPASTSTGTGNTSLAFRLGNNYTKNQAYESIKEVLKSDWFTNANLVDQQFIISRYQSEFESEAAKNKGANSIYNILLSRNIDSLKIKSSSKDIATLSWRSELQKADKTVDQSTELRYKMIDLIVYWTNIIRSSVINNSENPMYGPPLIRLKHGIMYQDIPCICMDYSIEANEAAGYDLDTLLPRQLKISLKLEELRTGSFGKFDPTNASIVERDNLAGWEAVILGPTTSLDPGYGGYGATSV
jgi:hypothetical protein